MESRRVEPQHIDKKSFTSEYMKGIKLGRGQYGDVYEIKRLRDQKIFAAKFMDHPEQHLGECNIMSKDIFEDQHTMNCEEFFINNDEVLSPQMVVILQRALSDFHEFLKNHPKPLSEKKAINFMS